MGHGKETPRQKMIGMMYLVLTAMLALNVAKEVLDAFTLVDGGLTTTIENFAVKNDGLYDKFNMAYEQNPEKVGDWKTHADEVKSRSQALYEFMNECKIEIVSKKDEEAIHDGEVHLGDVQVLDDTNFPGEIMILNKKGEELKGKIDEHREYLLSLIEDKEKYATTVEAIEGILSTEVPEEFGHAKKGVTPTWESTYFEHLPLASVIVLLSKMQGDVRNTEAEMLNFLLGQVDAGDFKVNVIEPVVIANSNYIFRGQEYRAQVFLAAYDSTNIPDVVVDGDTLTTEGGKGIYTKSYNRTGIYEWGGTISIEKDGQVTEKTFTQTFEVAESSATVSATGMNVFYRGIPNPVEIAVGGVAESDVRARISSGTIKRVRAGTYVVKPGPGGNKDIATVSVYADIDGSSKLMSRADFRVYALPTPDAIVNGIKGSSGALTVGSLSQLKNVEAEAKDFVFEVDYKVISFEVAFQGQGGMWSSLPSKSDKFTSQQKQLFRQLRTGQRIMIEKIKATGPDGVIRNLNNITITVR